jgi:hypothetical protein
MKLNGDVEQSLGGQEDNSTQFSNTHDRNFKGERRRSSGGIFTYNPK